jgi:hypothetical protein
VHFKSSPNLFYWSTLVDKLRSQSETSENFIRTIWVEFGCPGHGKGPWDGLGAVIKVTLTLMIMIILIMLQLIRYFFYFIL